MLQVPLTVILHISMGELSEKEVYRPPFKSDLLGLGKNHTKCSTCNIRLMRKTGRIFFKQWLNAVCGRTSQNNYYLLSTCVGVTARSRTWQARNAAKGMLYNDSAWVEEGQGEERNIS